MVARLRRNSVPSRLGRGCLLPIGGGGATSSIWWAGDILYGLYLATYGVDLFAREPETTADAAYELAMRAHLL